MLRINLLFFVFILSSCSLYDPSLVPKTSKEIEINKIFSKKILEQTATWDENVLFSAEEGNIEYKSFKIDAKSRKDYSKFPIPDLRRITSNYSGNYRLFICTNIAEFKGIVFIVPMLFFTQESSLWTTPIKHTDDGKYEIFGRIALLNGLRNSISDNTSEQGYTVPKEYQIEDVAALKDDIIKNHAKKLGTDKVQLRTLPIDTESSLAIRAIKDNTIIEFYPMFGTGYFEKSYYTLSDADQDLSINEEIIFNKFSFVKSGKIDPDAIEKFLEISNYGFILHLNSFARYRYPIMQHDLKIHIPYLINDFLKELEKYIKDKDLDKNIISFEEVELLGIFNFYLLNFLKKNKVPSKDLDFSYLRYHLANIFFEKRTSDSKYYLRSQIQKTNYLNDDNHNLTWLNYGESPRNVHVKLEDANLQQVSEIKEIKILASELTPSGISKIENMEVHPNTYLTLEVETAFENSSNYKDLAHDHKLVAFKETTKHECGQKGILECLEWDEPRCPEDSFVDRCKNDKVLTCRLVEKIYKTHCKDILVPDTISESVFFGLHSTTHHIQRLHKQCESVQDGEKCIGGYDASCQEGYEQVCMKPFIRKCLKYNTSCEQPVDIYSVTSVLGGKARAKTEKKLNEVNTKGPVLHEDIKVAFSIEDYFQKSSSIVYCPLKELISLIPSKSGVAGILHIRNTHHCNIFNENYSLFRSKAHLIGFVNNVHVEEEYEYGIKETTSIWSFDLNTLASTHEVINKYFADEKPKISYDEPLTGVQKITFDFMGRIKKNHPILKSSIIKR